MARAIHAASTRGGKQWGVINCAALPRELLDSELFGYAKGAFTGANTDRPGRFESCNGGTLFLDEVGDMPAETQVRLLRMLQEGEVQRLGETRVRKVDVRIVAATNRDLIGEMASGRFRDDLFYRLAVLVLRIPPLRERPEDIVPLAKHSLGRDRADDSLSGGQRYAVQVADEISRRALRRDYEGSRARAGDARYAEPDAPSIVRPPPLAEATAPSPAGAAADGCEAPREPEAAAAMVPAAAEVVVEPRS